MHKPVQIEKNAKKRGIFVKLTMQAVFLHILTEAVGGQCKNKPHKPTELSVHTLLSQKLGQ